MGSKAELQASLNGNESVPVTVQHCAEFFAELGIWHIFSQNLPATSCQDAARKRNRLGHRGIPLWDELKSFIGECRKADSTSILFLAHCRGDRELDFDKVCHALGCSSKIRRLTDVEAEGLGFVYGTVNPFLVPSGVHQVFDIEMMNPVGAPGTIMTNAGCHTWAVEFDPTELVARLAGAEWADICSSSVVDCNGEDEKVFRGVRKPETIGILTGNPMDSGLDLSNALNAHVRRLLGENSLGDVSMPQVIMVSTPYIGISMEMDLREQPLRNLLLEGVDALCTAGARILAHPAHTTHYFSPDMANRATARGARFLSIAEITAFRLRSLNIREIALLGTHYVTDFNNRWSVYREVFQGLKVHVPSLNGWDKIHALGYEVQQKGPTPACFNWMRDLLREEVPASCEHVVLAMTEFTPIVRQLKTRGRQGKVLLDPIDIYGEALAREYLGLPAE